MNLSNNAVKQTVRITSFLLALVTGWLGSERAAAQSPPVLVKLKGASVAVPGWISNLQVVEDRAYVTWDSGNMNLPGGLEIFDVKNLLKPVRLGGLASRTRAQAVWVVGRYAYMVGGTGENSTKDAGLLEIVDVSDAADPKWVGGVETAAWANGIRVAGNYAFVSENARWTGTNRFGALEIFDVSEPTRPLHRSTFDSAGSVTSVEVSGGYAYIADGVTDLQVLDVSDPTNPQRVGFYLSDIVHNFCGFEAGGPARQVQVVGNRAYSTGDNGLHVLDISDPRNPVSIGDNFCFPIQSFQLSGRYAYATIWSSTANGFMLAILDASDPANLVGVGLVRDWPSSFFYATDGWLYAPNDRLLIYKVLNRPASRSDGGE